MSDADDAAPLMAPAGAASPSAAFAQAWNRARSSILFGDLTAEQVDAFTESLGAVLTRIRAEIAEPSTPPADQQRPAAGQP